MKIFAETNRFILREILPEDVDGMFHLDSDPAVHRYLGNKPVTTKDQVLAVIQYVRQQYVDHGIGRWAIIDKSSHDFVGWAGLKLVKEPVNNHTDFYDVGYRLRSEYWGQGIATECAIASLAYGFDQMKLGEIYAAAHLENTASNKILIKIGLKRIASFDDDGAPHHWYKIEREDWLNRQ